jgi:hypothetical protein
MTHPDTLYTVTSRLTAQLAREVETELARIDDEHKPTPLADVKRGEYIRLKPSPTAPVWVRGEYDRASKRYWIAKADDMNHGALRKGGVVVYTGFTY